VYLIPFKQSPTLAICLPPARGFDLAPIPAFHGTMGRHLPVADAPLESMAIGRLEGSGADECMDAASCAKATSASRSWRCVGYEPEAAFSRASGARFLYRRPPGVMRAPGNQPAHRAWDDPPHTAPTACVRNAPMDEIARDQASDASITCPFRNAYQARSSSRFSPTTTAKCLPLLQFTLQHEDPRLS
jgi:hypothetical protein